MDAALSFAARCLCSENICKGDTLRQRFGIEYIGLPSDGVVVIVRTRSLRLYWPSFSGRISCHLRISFPNNTGNTAVQILPQIRPSATPLGFKDHAWDGKACEDHFSSLSGIIRVCSLKHSVIKF